MIVLVPQCPALYGNLDKTFGHQRRFSRKELDRLLEEGGFRSERAYQLNKISTPAWWISSRLLSHRHIGKLSLKIFDKTVWLWRLLDPILPWPGLSLIVVAVK